MSILYICIYRKHKSLCASLSNLSVHGLNKVNMGDSFRLDSSIAPNFLLTVLSVEKYCNFSTFFLQFICSNQNNGKENFILSWAGFRKFFISLNKSLNLFGLLLKKFMNFSLLKNSFLFFFELSFKFLFEIVILFRGLCISLDN